VDLINYFPFFYDTAHKTSFTMLDRRFPRRTDELYGGNCHLKKPTQWHPENGEFVLPCFLGDAFEISILLLAIPSNLMYLDLFGCALLEESGAIKEGTYCI
jgi:hypothetical protein